MATLKHGQTGDRYLLTVTNKASTDFHQAIPPPIGGFAIGVDSRRTFNLCLPLLVEYRVGRERLHPGSTDQDGQPRPRRAQHQRVIDWKTRDERASLKLEPRLPRKFLPASFEAPFEAIQSPHRCTRLRTD